VETVAALGLGVLLLAAFVAWEGRTAEPMLPMRLFRTRGFAAAGATAFLMSGSIFSAAFLMSQYFQLVLGYSPLTTGLRFLPWTATPVVVAPLAGVLSDRIGRRPVMVAGLLLQGGALGWVALVAAAGTGYGQLVVPLLAAGVGISMALAATPAAAMGVVAPADMGRASGAINTLQRFGGVFCIAVASAVFAANGHLGAAPAVTSGFRPALGVVAGLSVLGAMTALAAGRRRAAAAPPAVRSAAA